MDQFKHVLFFFAGVLFISSCISTKSIYRNDSFVVKRIYCYDDNVVTFKVRFNDTLSYNDRITIIKREIEQLYGLNETSYTIEESYGKLFNEYIYLISSVHGPLKGIITEESYLKP